MKNIVVLCLIVIMLVPSAYVYALPRDAELVLENIRIEPPYPKKGDLIEITADVYNAGLKNTNSFASIISVAYFVDGELLRINELGNVEPGISNKIQISSLPVWKSELGNHEIKIILDYHNTLNDQYDSSADNIVEKTFLIESLESTTISLDVYDAFIVPGKDMPKITVLLSDSNTQMPLINKKITLKLDNDEISLTTDRNGQISFSNTITSFGPVEVEAYFEGDSQYLPSNSTSTIYSFSKEMVPSLLMKINDPQNQYNFEDYLFDVVIFQDSYNNVIKKIKPDSTVLLDSKTFLLSLPTGHNYFAEVYLNGRLLFVTDKDQLKENSVLVNELKIPERATIKFKVLDDENQSTMSTLVKSWIYSVPIKGGSTDWIDVLPTNYGEPYVAEILLSDQKTVKSDPFFLFSGERKIIPITIGKQNLQSDIPSWVKNNAKWWAEDSIDDDSFIKGIQYLIKENILKIPPTIQGSSGSANEIPEWIKTNAGWWANGDIDDNSFVEGIQFLIKEGVMTIY